MKSILQYSVEVFGIHAPWFSWVTAVGLIFWIVWQIGRLYILSARQTKLCNKMVVEIKAIAAEFPFSIGQGLDSAAVDRLQKLFAGFPFMADKWTSFRSKLVIRSVPDEEGKMQVWMTESSAVLFPGGDFLGEDFNKRNFHSIPGLCTGIGLLMTFSAILVGLLDVSIVDNKVHGLQGLVGGLSGKFVSSIAALFAATIFLLLEKKEFHKLDKVRFKLIAAIDALVPLRPQSELLGDISQKIVEQTNSLSAFYTGLSGLSVGGSSSQNLEPVLAQISATLDKMSSVSNVSQAGLAEAVTEMNAILKRSEQSSPESLSGQMEVLLTDLQNSLSGSIDKMTSELTQALAANADPQSGGGGGGGAGLAQNSVEAMNQSFVNTEAALQELILHIKQLSQSQNRNYTSRSLVTALAGLAIMIFSNMADFLGAGRFMRFGHLQEVGVMVGIMIILFGLYLNPHFRRIVPSWATAAGGGLFVLLSFFPGLLGYKVQDGFGVLQFTGVFTGGTLLLYGIWKERWRFTPKKKVVSSAAI